MRRLIVEEPYSKSALLSRRLAAFSLAVALIGVAVARGGIDPPAALAVLSGSLGLAAAAIVFALLAFIVIWRTGRQGAGQAAAGLFLALLLLAYPAYLAAKAMHLPRLTDLSTDLADPPVFSASRVAQAARGGAAPHSLPASLRKAQAQAYPKILPILLDLDADEAYKAALKAVAASGWRIIEQTPPGAGRIGRRPYRRHRPQHDLGFSLRRHPAHPPARRADARRYAFGLALRAVRLRDEPAQHQGFRGGARDASRQEVRRFRPDSNARIASRVRLRRRGRAARDPADAPARRGRPESAARGQGPHRPARRSPRPSRRPL